MKQALLLSALIFIFVHIASGVYNELVEASREETCIAIVNDLMNELGKSYEQQDELHDQIEVMQDEFLKWYQRSNQLIQEANSDITCLEPECDIR